MLSPNARRFRRPATPRRAERRVEDAVPVGAGVRCCRRLSPSAGATVPAIAPFPVPARRTGSARTSGASGALAHGRLSAGLPDRQQGI